MSHSLKAIHRLRLRQVPVELGVEYAELPILYSTFASIYTLGAEMDLFIPLIVAKHQEAEPLELRWENSSESSPWVAEGDRLVKMDHLIQIEKEISEYRLGTEDWHKNGMIKIGHTNADVILLGVDDSIKDQVYLFGESVNFAESLLIARNIFTLFAQLELEPDIQNLEYYGVCMEEMAKKWKQNHYMPVG